MILTLSFCLAINVVIFAIVDSVLLRPLPVPDADAIVLMSNRYPKAGVGNLNTSSRGDYYDRLQKVSVFQEQAMFRFADQTLNIGGMPERILSMVAPTLRIGSTLLSLSAQRGQFVTQRLVVIYPFDRSNPVLRE